MLASLKVHLRDSMCPIGIKKQSHIRLPSNDYIYGYKKNPIQKGQIRVSHIKKITYKFYYFSYTKLEISPINKISFTT